MKISQQDYRNKYEIRVFHMPRSGSLAIKQWIASMFDEPIYFFNWPLYTHLRIDPFKAGKIWKGLKGTPAEKFFVPLPNMTHWDEKDIKPIRLKQKECLMYCHENYDIRDIKNLSVDRDVNIGKSEFRFDILILRDIFNWVASTIMDRGFQDSSIIRASYYKHAVQRIWKWKACAIEFLGESKYLENEKICISFNKWFVDEEYRISITNKLGLKYSTVTLDDVPRTRRGSSFDGLIYDGRAREMDCLNRWKVFRDNILYQELFKKNKDIIELSDRIFGKVVDEDFISKLES